MLPRQRLRIVSLVLQLVLTREFLIQTVGHLKVRPAEHQRELQEVIRGWIVIERSQVACATPGVVEVLDSRWIKIAVCSRARRHCEPSEPCDMSAEGRGCIAGHEASNVPADLARDRHIKS